MGMPRRVWDQYRSLIAAVALLIATPLVAFGFTICWTIPPSKTDITSELAATARLADPGFRVLTDGALNSAGDRAYFLVIDDDGRRQIASLRPSDGPQPPQVIATQGLPDGPTSAQIAIGGDLLVLATASELISTHAVDVPETATIQQVPTMAKFAAITWEPATGRLLRLGERLECYDWVGGSFVLRTTLPIEGSAMAVDTNLGRICIRTGLDLRTFRWEDGAAAPVEGTPLRTFDGISSRLLSTGNGYVLDEVPGEPVTAYRLDPFPSAPILRSSVARSPIHPMASGFLHGGFTYQDLQYMTGTTGPYTQAYESSYWFGPTRAVAAAKSVPWAFVVNDAPDGRLGRSIYQWKLGPAQPPGYLHVGVWDVSDMLVTGISFTALKPGATVKAVLYRLPESTAPPTQREFVPYWTSDPIVTTVGESEVMIPADSGLAGKTDKWAVVLRADQEGVFARSKADSAVFDTYRLPSPDGVFPARFSHPDLLPTRLCLKKRF